MKGVDVLLSAFNLSINEKISFAEDNRNKFLIEFKKYKNLKYTLDKNFREKREGIGDFFNNITCSDPEIIYSLTNYSSCLKEIYIKCQETKEFRSKSPEIVASLVHMFINRIFVLKQREQEMAIYHFLAKFLTTELMKKKALAAS